MTTKTKPIMGTQQLMQPSGVLKAWYLEAVEKHKREKMKYNEQLQKFDPYGFGKLSHNEIESLPKEQYDKFLEKIERDYPHQLSLEDWVISHQQMVVAESFYRIRLTIEEQIMKLDGYYPHLSDELTETLFD